MHVLQVDVAARLRGLQLVVAHVEPHLVVEAQLQLRHARQTHLHLDGAHDLAVQHRAVARHQQIHLLDHVQEHVVLLVLDALLAPADHVGQVRGHHRRLLQTLALLRDVLLHHLRVRDLCLRL